MSFKVAFRENSSCHVVGRITMVDGTGSAVGNDGEAYFIKQADLTSIVRSVFDLSSSTPNTPVIGPTTLALSDVVLDTVVTDRALWKGDSVGYNFKDRIPNTAFPNGGHIYSVEYRMTPTAGSAYAWTAEPLIGAAEDFVGP